MKKEHSHINDELLVKHLLGEATAAEQDAATAWLKQSDTNRKHYEQLKTIWEESRKLQAKSTVNEEAAWERFQQRVQNEQQQTTKAITLPKRRMNWMQLAASLALLVGAVWIVNFMVNGNQVTVVADNGVITETLPDGTTVTLNKSAELKYAKNFKGDTRNVILKGEAFFDVTPNKNKPFVINVNEVQVTVVGTSFNVKGSEKKTEVIVETGIVEVAKKQNSVTLNPDEKATVYNNKPSPVKEANVDALYKYYRTKTFVCNNTPLSRLVDILNEAYDVNIIIKNEQLKTLPITTTFKEQTLDTILDIISDTFSIRVERDGDTIILK